MSEQPDTPDSRLCTILRPNYPAIAQVLDIHGLQHNPQNLLSCLTTDHSDPAMKAVYTALKGLLNISNNSLAAAIQERDHFQCELNASQLEQKSALADTLASALANIKSSPKSIPGCLSKDPEKFNREEKDMTKRQQQYTTWKSLIRNCFAQDYEIFNSERKGILHICDNTKWHWKSASDLIASLDKQYETVTLKLDASIKFDELFQRKTPFPNFIATFTTLAHQCGKTNEQKMEALKKKVSVETSTNFSGLDNPPAFDDFDSWVQKGQRFHENLFEFDHFQKNKTASSRPYIQP
ncbi:hypothetical protein K3495_g4881 [Podosphaera aphanis]|nr:hypothetical protein K3495_g4881 [Podosphaera aphanis]